MYEPYGCDQYVDTSYMYCNNFDDNMRPVGSPRAQPRGCKSYQGYDEAQLALQANPAPMPHVALSASTPPAIPAPAPVAPVKEGFGDVPLDPTTLLFICFVFILMLLCVLVKQAADIKLLLSLLVTKKINTATEG